MSDLMDLREQVRFVAREAARAAVEEVADAAAKRAVERVLGEDLHDLKAVARAYRTGRRIMITSLVTSLIGTAGAAIWKAVSHLRGNIN